MKTFFLSIILILSQQLFSSAANEFGAATKARTGFIENKGQVVDQFGNSRSDVKYILQSQSFKLILKENSWCYELEKAEHFSDPKRKKFLNEIRDPQFDLNDDVRFHSSRTEVKLLNSNLHPTIIAESESIDVVNYYKGKKPLDGIIQVHHYSKITYQNIYPNIDLVWDLSAVRKTNLGVAEYSFIVRPGGNPEQIQMVYEGNGLVKNENDKIQFESSLGKIEESVPQYFLNNAKRSTPGAFIKNGNTISFQQIKFDRSKIFVIDPTITFSTYFGGDTSDFAEDLELDAQGNIFVTGRTGSTSNIATSGSYDNVYGGGGYDIFILKFNKDFQLQWSTYFGGERVDYGWEMALDGSSNIYLAGESYSSGLATSNAQQKTIEGSESDGLLAKFTSDGILKWSRYFGGGNKDQMLSIAIDNTGRLITTGYTLSTDSIATANAYDNSFGGNGDIFLAAFDSVKGDVIWSTYYGTTKDDRGHHVTVDKANNIYLSGTALSKTGIATSGADHEFLMGDFDGFLAKFSADGFPIWGTYVGGQYEDRGRDCIIDHSGNILMTGFTQSDTGMATPGTWMPEHFLGIDSTAYYTLDAFLIKYDTSGKRIWGTYFGDTLSETSRSVAVNSYNEIFITGATFSAMGIVYNDPYQTNLGGTTDVWYAKFDSTGNLVFSSYFGGSNEEQVGGYGFLIRVDADDNFFLCGSTASEDSISTPDSYQTNLAGAFDVFIAKFFDTTIYDGINTLISNSESRSINVFPNPAAKDFNVVYNSNIDGAVTVTIFSVEGKKMLDKTIPVIKGINKFDFLTQGIVKGIYLVTINDGSKSLSSKILVE
jgi:hypothetical protein